MRRELNALTYPQTAAHISIGWAMVDITPDRPVQLMGQYYERVSEGVRDPLTATALALDSGREQAVIVSCDLIDAPQAVQERVRLRLASRLPGLDVAAVLMAATHTHTAPVLEDGWYPTPAADLMRTEEYVDFLVERLVDVVVEAWDAREPGGVSWGLARAVVGHNRRVLYADGAAQMYGRTDVPSFSGIEGGRDDGVELLYTWDSGGGLTGAAINVACPSQAVAHLSVVSAEFWGEARQQLRARLTPELFVLPLCGAAGDQAPRDMVRRGRGDPDLWNRPGVAELGCRIANAVERALLGASAAVQTEVVFRHTRELLDLPARKVTPEEAGAVRARQEVLAQQEIASGADEDGEMRQNDQLLERYENQGECPLYRMELHVLRIGDVALVTNPFELFLDYGLRIKARSQALQTMVVQLACGSGGYLPTARAVAAGGYGARVLDGEVGPEGGQALVERSVELINSLMSDAAG